MRCRHVVLPSLPVLMALVAGCVPRPVDQTAERAEPRTSDRLPQAKADFEEMLSDKLDDLEEEIHELKAKVASLTDAARAKWAEEVAELDAKQQAAREKLGEVTRATGAAWGHLRDGATKAWEDLERAVRNARSD